MTAFVDIPKDVQEAARNQCSLAGVTPASDMRVHCECVAAFAILAERARSGWQPMSTAPTNGKHVILAIKSGSFVYAIEGAFMEGKWMNAADIDVEPLCWMPKNLIPDAFLPWTDEFKAAAAPQGAAA